MAEEEGEFKVRDKRRVFVEEEKSEAAATSEPLPESASRPAGETHSPEEAHAAAAMPPPNPEITFAAFVFSLSHSAFVHLGEEPDPVTGRLEVSIPMAKETIDLLSVLEEKTRGNLSPDEEHLMRNLLYTLRMTYVEKAARR